MGRQVRARASPDPQGPASGRDDSGRGLSETRWPLYSAVNLSEGREPASIARFAALCSSSLLDVHSDPAHNRSVLSLAGEPDELCERILALAEAAIEHLDIARHRGVHPRVGTLDVVPICPPEGRVADAMALRARLADELARIGLPSFSYGALDDGTSRSLPEVRRGAFRTLAPDAGPAAPHPRAGAVCLGVRGPLVAFNVWLEGCGIEATRSIAAALRSPALRTLGFDLGGATQVSCNLVDPSQLGPDRVLEAVEARLDAGARVLRCELVGLVPRLVLEAIDPARWARLDLAEDRSIEWRLEQRGWPGAQGASIPFASLSE